MRRAEEWTARVGLSFITASPTGVSLLGRWNHVARPSSDVGVRRPFLPGRSRRSAGNAGDATSALTTLLWCGARGATRSSAKSAWPKDTEGTAHRDVPGNQPPAANERRPTPRTHVCTFSECTMFTNVHFDTFISRLCRCPPLRPLPPLRPRRTRCRLPSLSASCPTRA
jgi:hypothetical protein